MRLHKVETGYRMPLRLKVLRTIVSVLGLEIPDVVHTMLYRPELFGRYYSDLLHDLMRGPSEWTVGERELFAAFVSRQNQCPF